eukprot:TRINITY_DN245_c0_g1_i3.p1 TRINITY_DN245_c0_g1~~TRINITY_DN245_c0_g1_i3.p1  ORF type:complete len:300 (-),score=54.01 TRINITY_DN245_c0_g1_i3:612-1412(-)
MKFNLAWKAMTRTQRFLITSMGIFVGMCASFILTSATGGLTAFPVKAVTSSQSAHSIADNHLDWADQASVQVAEEELRPLLVFFDDARPSSLKLISKFGDDGADALLRHGTVGEQLIGEFAEGGVKALNQVTAQNGRRLAMLAGDGVVKPQLIDVVCRHGDRACEFIWKNKGALAAGTTMAVFLANPEQFLDGTVQLTEIVADAAIRPLAEEAGRHYGGTIVLMGLLTASLIFAARLWLKRGLWGFAGGWLIRRGRSYFHQPPSRN